MRRAMAREQTKTAAKATGSALLIPSGTMPNVVEPAKASSSLPVGGTSGRSITARDTL